jgi:aryl-phospho-beta-D-glucosidase BglC (GH1 family)
VNRMKDNWNPLIARRQIVYRALKGLGDAKFYTTILISIMLLGTAYLSSAMSSLVSSATIRSSGTVAFSGRLHIEGKYIKNDLGQIVHLSGINKHGFEDDPRGHWQTRSGGVEWNTFNPTTVAANLDAMKSWGINFIRSYSTAQFWIENTGNHRQIIKDLATMCSERGMYFMYSMWHILPGTDQTRMPFPPHITAREEAVIPSEDAFVDMWRSIADELKDCPNIIFEFWNEPGGTGSLSDWQRVWQRCIDAVRGTGATNLISLHYAYSIWMNLDYGNGVTLSYVEDYPLNDTLGNIFYTPHNYRSDIHRTVPERINCWTYEDLKLGFEMCLVDYVLNTLQIPVMIGEFGPNMWQTGEELEHELDYYENCLTIFNEWEMSYSVFWWWLTGQYQHLTTARNYQPNIAGEILINALSYG